MRVGIAILLVLLSMLSAPVAVQGQEAVVAGPSWTREDFMVTSWDETQLAASVWIPKDPTSVPAILITNGWNNRHDRGTELRYAERYANLGYVVLGWTSRGWGNSEGEIELDGAAEQNDTRTMIDLLQQNPNEWPVLQDCFVARAGQALRKENTVACASEECRKAILVPAMGDPAFCRPDPRVGMVGDSYGGGIQFLTAQADPRIDSIIPRITWSNLLDALAPNDVLKVGWITELYGTGQTVSRGAPVPNQQPGDEPDAGGPSDDLTRWYAESAAANEPTDEMRHEIGWVRSLHPGKLNTPTLLIQGWGDTLFQPNEALATYHELLSRNVTVRLIFYPGGHGQSLAADAPASVFVDQQMDDWFNVTLRGRAPTLPPYPIIRYRDVEVDFVGELQWPPAHMAVWRGYLGDQRSLGPTAAESSVDLVNPIVPTTCVDVPSFQSQAGSNCPYSVERTSALWAGPPLETDAEVTGTPVAHLVIGSTQLTDVRVFVTLEDVAADGTAKAVWRQTMPMRLGPSTGQSVNITMQATTHTFPKGHRIGLQVATTDLGFHPSREPGTITVMSSPVQPSWLDVPMVPKDKWGDREAPRLRQQGIVLLAEDDFGIEDLEVIGTSNVTVVRCPDMVATCHTYGEPDGRRRILLHVQAVANETIQVTAVDMVGKVARLNWTAPPPMPHEDPTCEEVDACPGRSSPAIAPAWTILALGAVSLLASRRRSWR